MKNAQLGIAVIGCGRMGRRRVRVAAEHPHAKLVGVVDSDRKCATELAREFNTSAHNDSSEILSRSDIDCVVVSVPNKWHLENVIAALNAKKHVLCEKPLSRNPEEARMMVDAAKQNGVTLTVGSNLRFFPNVLKAKELVDDSAIGELIFLRAWIGHEGWTVGGWYADPEISGGGTFLDNGCHLFDLTRWFLGEMRSGIGVLGTNVWPIRPLEDNGYGIFKSVDGKTALLHSSWTEWAGYMYMEIYGTEGYVRIDNRSGRCKTIVGLRSGKEEVFDYSGLPANSYQVEFESYVRSLQRGEQPLPSGYDGMRAVQMAWAVYESSRTGKTVDF